MQRLILIGIVALAVIAALVWRFPPGAQTPTVVVYVSHDEVFSEPILKDFEKETGIRCGLSTIRRKRKARER